ncbi:RsfA family transcriptional regulator [Shouchella patagoniensis]|uniref:RsfA family transcriptional regulator n=1 Tax=Shouchella patagoniensis TaxID=228576 RepID=UPI000994E55C|nr:RsfA family transcriptional regulator [Shouchella patagoniensis]
MKIRQDAWSHEDDVLLAETVLNHIKEGSTQLKAFDEVGDALNRTSAACGFRWNAVVRQKHLTHIDQAKRERKERKRELSSSFFQPKTFERTNIVEPSFYRTPSNTSGSVTIDSIIVQLRQLENQTEQSSSLKLENDRLRTELKRTSSKLNDLETMLARNKQEHSMIEEDYQSLISIMNRARRMAILEDTIEDQTAFRMEGNGNLEKLEK